MSHLVSIPADLMEQIGAAARAADKTPEEWVEEALHRQLDDNRWQKMFARHDHISGEQGIRESDIPEMVEQARRER
jgi:hypothetical protein